MTLIADVLLAGPLGYFAGRRSLAIFLVLWAIIFVIQTPLVRSDSGLDFLYWVFNAVFLALGIGLHALGVRFREKRDAASAGEVPVRTRG